MKAAKVGERCAVYIEGKRYVATVRQVLEFGNLRLTAEPPCPILYPVVHPRQCRRLKPQREWWLVKHGGNCIAPDQVFVSPHPGWKCGACNELAVVRVREIKERK